MPLAQFPHSTIIHNMPYPGSSPEREGGGGLSRLIRHVPRPLGSQPHESLRIKGRAGQRSASPKNLAMASDSSLLGVYEAQADNFFWRPHVINLSAESLERGNPPLQQLSRRQRRRSRPGNPCQAGLLSASIGPPYYLIKRPPAAKSTGSSSCIRTRWAFNINSPKPDLCMRQDAVGGTATIWTRRRLYRTPLLQRAPRSSRPVALLPPDMPVRLKISQGSMSG
ncbi:hypothetical protein LX36DRAFT_310137 [Colletotrichum falcatum]|nr:hypothetical protein LX36DRAFT_310137 [Colletotrichum falcatum]